MPAADRLEKLLDQRVRSDFPHRDLRPSVELSDGRSAEAAILQMAADEARIRTPIDIEAGSVVLLRIASIDGPILLATAAEVHWSQPQRNGCELGLYLNQEVPDELLRWPSWDRRLQLRYTLGTSGQIWWQGNRSASPVRVINYSSSGIGILTSDRGYVGKEFILTTDSEPQVTVQGSACWQVNHARGYMLGCELPKMQGRRFAGLYEPHSCASLDVGKSFEDDFSDLAEESTQQKITGIVDGE